MKGNFTDYSLSISLLIVFVLFWLLEYLTLPGESLESIFWHNGFTLLKYFGLNFFGFVWIATYLIRRGSPRTIEFHTKTQKKLDKIIEYLEIDK